MAMTASVAPRARPDRRRGRVDRAHPRPRRRTTSSWPCTRSCGASTARTSRPGSTCAGSRQKGRRCWLGRARTPGVIDAGDGIAVAIRIESHNHPSAIEPYQGAATGVGGIIRDIFTMGARPIALMDPLRFGPPRRRPQPVGRQRGGERHFRLRQRRRGPDRGRRARICQLLRGQPARQRPVLRRCCRRTASFSGGRQARATWLSCSARRPAGTASAG